MAICLSRIGESGSAGKHGLRFDSVSADNARSSNLVVDVERGMRLLLPDSAEPDGAGHRDGGKDRKLDVGAVLVSDLIEYPSGQQPKASQVALITKSTRAEAAASNFPY